MRSDPRQPARCCAIEMNQLLAEVRTSYRELGQVIRHRTRRPHSKTQEARVTFIRRAFWARIYSAAGEVRLDRNKTPRWFCDRWLSPLEHRYSLVHLVDSGQTFHACIFTTFSPGSEVANPAHASINGIRC
jgi:hypothetical protein